ncbi:MAG: carboxymuconolactone decarboxylase family protein [Myxococcota bacterium]
MPTNLDVPACLDALEAFGRGEGPHPAHVTKRERATLDYALALTHHPAAMTPAHLQAMRDAGLDDAEILDANQVTAYFAYVNRLVDGLGVELEGDPRP